MALSEAQKTFCVGRATGATIKEAVAKAGVSQRTGEYWNVNPDCLAYIDALQEPIRAEVFRIFKGKAVRAANRIAECIEPGYNLAAAAVNLRAAELTLKHAGFEPATKTQVGGDPDNPLPPFVLERTVYVKGE